MQILIQIYLTNVSSFPYSSIILQLGTSVVLNFFVTISCERYQVAVKHVDV
jgi:hypothetical protein